MSGVDMKPSIPGWLSTRRIRARSSWRSAIAIGSSWILRLARPGMVGGQDDQLAVGRHDAPPRAPVRLPVGEAGLPDPDVGDRLVQSRAASRREHRIPSASSAPSWWWSRSREVAARSPQDRFEFGDILNGAGPNCPDVKSTRLQEHAPLKPQRVRQGAVTAPRQLGQEPEHQGAGHQRVAPRRVAAHDRHPNLAATDSSVTSVQPG